MGFVQFGFVMGASLKDPRGLLEGKGSSVRHIKVRAPADIDRPAFTALLKQAMRLRRQPRRAQVGRPGVKALVKAAYGVHMKEAQKR